MLPRACLPAAKKIMLCRKEETNIHSVKNIFKTLDTKWCKWVLSLWLLCASCLTPIYTVPFLAARSNISDPNDQSNNSTLIIESFLEKTLYELRKSARGRYDYIYAFFYGWHYGILLGNEGAIAC